MDQKVKHFVLVHGICVGAWSWYKLAPLLKSAGHRVTALNLGASGVNPKRMDEVASISDYVQPLMEFMGSLPQEEKVILVGHSYGGMSISLAMEAFPDKISVAVFVTSFMPNVTSPPATFVLECSKWTPMENVLDMKFSFDHGPENPPTSAILGPNVIESTICQNCQIEDVELVKMLVRPSKLFLKDLGKERLLTAEKFGSVNRIFIICEEDELLKVGFQKWLIEQSRSPTAPINNVRTIGIAGSDHMPMLSKSTELSLCLLEIAQTF